MHRRLLLGSVFINLVFAAALLHWGPNVDYLGFYAAGRTAISSPQFLFNESVQKSAQQSTGVQMEYLPFLHLPHEVIFFAPLSLLPYALSRLFWQTLSLLALIASSWIIGKSFAVSRVDILCIAAALLPTYICLHHGQDSIVLLLCLAVSMALMKSNQEELAGALIAFSLFKPQVGLIVAGAMLLNRRWRFIWGFLATCAVLFAGCFAIFGGAVFSDLAALIRRSQQTTLQSAMAVNPDFYPTIRGLAYQLTGHGTSVTLIASLALVIIFSFTWLREQSPEFIYSSAILIGCLVAFNWHFYDLVLLLMRIAMAPKAWGSRLLLYSPIVMALAAFTLIPLLCLPMFSLCVFFLRASRPHKLPERGKLGLEDAQLTFEAEEKIELQQK